MRRIISLSALAVLLGLFSVAGYDQANGQGKDKKKGDPPTAVKAGTIEVYKAKDGYRFRIKDHDGKTVAMPTKGYDEKEDCLKAIEFVKTTLNNAKPMDVKD
jgi:uncharacterized protein YegP (UPF0339 family)